VRPAIALGRAVCEIIAHRSGSTEVEFESREGFLLATATGLVSLNDAIQLFKGACDAAFEHGLNKILADFSGAHGELSDLERYELGRSATEYYLTRPLAFKVATVGNPPLINGFAAQVASNRGVVAETFSDFQQAAYWLNLFGHSPSTQTS